MTTIRVAHRRRFTTIDQATVNDERLSFRARGVLAWLLDKADDWHCDSEVIARAGTEGREAVRVALKELEDHGYLRRERVQGDRGHWCTITWVYEVPGQTEDGFPVVGQPVVGRPVVGQPAVGQPAVGFPGAITKTETKDVEQEDSSFANNTNGGVPAGTLVRKKNEFAHDYTEELRLSGAFELFWTTYARTGPKSVCREKWKKAVLTEGVDPDVLQVGLERWCEYWRMPGAAAVKWPQGWFKDRYWENDPPIAALNASQPPMSTTDRNLAFLRSV
jgi:hypothetical protein